MNNVDHQLSNYNASTLLSTAPPLAARMQGHVIKAGPAAQSCVARLDRFASSCLGISRGNSRIKLEVQLKDPWAPFQVVDTARWWTGSCCFVTTLLRTRSYILEKKVEERSASGGSRILEPPSFPIYNHASLTAMISGHKQTRADESHVQPR